MREEAGKKEESEESITYLEKIRNLEGQAKGASKGVYAGKGGNIESAYEVPDPNALVTEFKDKKIDTVIEKVLTGDRLIVRLLLSPEKHVQTLLVIGGIRAPSTKRVTPDGKEVPAEPFGAEAQQFVEQRLLQRRITVQLLGVTPAPANQLIGTIFHPQGNIAKFLLSAGLARCHDQHVTVIGSEMSELRKAEKSAKDAKKGVFTGAAPTKAKAADAEYIVSRVFSADTLFIRTRNGPEKRINLSSVRQPKSTDPKQAPFAAEAKEFLRKKLIGKHVKVSIDGKKPATEGYEEREVATITFNGKNVALQLVEAGYASAIRHRRDDDDRSPEYDALLLAEEAAQKEGKGMWSPKPPAAKKYTDYSETVTKAKMEASVLQRQKRVPAIVDFVKSGSRFTLLIPRENAKLTFVLSGIRAPKSARNPGESGDPFGQEAHEFANRRCMQRDVEIDVETIDKVGGFIGTLYVGRENFAKALVEEGLAEVHAYSAEQSGHGNELFTAEKKAKEGKKGLWHAWDPSQDEEEVEAPAANGTNGTNGEADVARRKDYRDVVVTHVTPEGKLKVQEIGAGTTALSELMNAFRSFHLNKSNDQPLSGPPKAGEFVAAKFTVDNEWYRARVRRVDREAKKAEVVYVDYGNDETVPWSRLRALAQPQFSTQKLKPQASDAVLSFAQLPTSAQYLREAVAYIAEITEGVELVANVDYISEGTWTVTLMDKNAPGIDDSINAHVIGAGLAMVPKKLKAWEKAASDTLTTLKKLESEAKESRRGMWEYGDITED